MVVHCPLPPAKGTVGLPTPRGLITDALFADLRHHARLPYPDRVFPMDCTDGDGQLALFVLNQLRLGGFGGLGFGREGDVRLLKLHAMLQRELEESLRRNVAVQPAVGSVREVMHKLLSDHGASTVPSTRPAFLKRMRCRSPYFLQESHAHALLLARLAAEPVRHLIADVVAGEFGVGHRATHAQLYAEALASVGIDSRPHSHLDEAPAAHLAFANLLLMSCTQPRLAPWGVGQLAALELDSVEPNRRMVEACQHLAMPSPVRRFHQIHVHADAEHADLMGRVLDTDWCRTHAIEVLTGAAALIWVLDQMASAEASWSQAEPVNDNETPRVHLR